MSHHNIDKPEIEEMLSRYIDGELSERECTEIKRMAVNDEKFSARIVRMKNQKELLGNLPVEIAPAGIADAVKLSLERKFLLNGTPASTNEMAGARYLFSRRLMTAAIIFILFGGLLYMVLQVIIPPADISEVVIDAPAPRMAAPEIKLPAKPFSPALDVEPHVFSASLDLTSKDAITMNAFISKVIFNENLLNNTFKNSHDGVTSYYVTTDITKLRALLDGLVSGWDKCEQAKLTAYGSLPGTDVVVENTTAAQVVAIFRQDEFLGRIEVARDFADINAVIGASEESDSYALGNGQNDNDIFRIPVIPELTSSKRPSINDFSETGLEKVSLTITVKGI